MTNWIRDLQETVAADSPAALVTVAGAQGSTPRESGTKMVVTPDRILGTIGGGNLEYRATELARAALASGSTAPALHDFPLGPSLGQCCGGRTTLLIEPIAAAPDWLGKLDEGIAAGAPAALITEIATGSKHIVTADHDGTAPPPFLNAARDALANRLSGARLDTDNNALIEVLGSYGSELWLFGAGHVGRAIVHVLGPLADLYITWIDSRSDQFPRQVPANVRIVESDDPTAETSALPAGAYVLVMTHSHGLDYDIVETILRRGDFSYLGLIGSATKRARFEQRWRHRGGSETALARLVSPIGIDGIGGKEPAAIAIAVAAEIQRLRERAGTAEAARQRSA